MDNHGVHARRAERKAYMKVEDHDRLLWVRVERGSGVDVRR